MVGFSTMVRMNLKLLLRNKGYLSFLIILPLLSVIMLNVNGSVMADNEDHVIQELEKENEQILNLANTKLNVKVYDCSNSELSEYILKEQVKTGCYQVIRYGGSAMDLVTLRVIAIYSMNHNIIGAVLYIPEDFEQHLLESKESNMVLLEGSKDERMGLLKHSLNTYLNSLIQYASLTNNRKEELIQLLQSSMDHEMSKEIVDVAVGDALSLTKDQQAKSTSLGFSLAFLTMGFLFSGVFIAATVVEERENRVYNRIILSKLSLSKYGLVKLVMVLLTVLLQTGIIAIAIKLIVRSDFGIPYGSYLLLVFFLGLIFNLMSVMIGITTNNVMTSNYIVFLIWSISALLAGLYFPLEGASGWFSKISLLMPQRWVVKAAEMIMADRANAYSIYLLVVAAYIVVIMSIGLMGMKIKRKE